MWLQRNTHMPLISVMFSNNTILSNYSNFLHKRKKLYQIKEQAAAAREAIIKTRASMFNFSRHFKPHFWAAGYIDMLACCQWKFCQNNLSFPFKNMSFVRSRNSFYKPYIQNNPMDCWSALKLPPFFAGDSN